MILDDINPFIRFAEIITLIKYPRQYVLAQDCRPVFMSDGHGFRVYTRRETFYEETP